MNLHANAFRLRHRCLVYLTSKDYYSTSKNSEQQKGQLFFKKPVVSKSASLLAPTSKSASLVEPVKSAALVEPSRGDAPLFEPALGGGTSIKDRTPVADTRIDGSILNGWVREGMRKIFENYLGLLRSGEDKQKFSKHMATWNAL